MAPTATGPLGGGAGCTGRLTFRGYLDPGTSCAVQSPFHAAVTGLHPIARAEGGPGIAGSAPVRLLDENGNLVGSEQAQFLTDALYQSDALADCGTLEGLRRALWSDTVEVFAP